MSFDPVIIKFCPKLTVVTAALCPSNVWTHYPLFLKNNLALVSCEPVRTCLESESKQVTLALWPDYVTIWFGLN